MRHVANDRYAAQERFPRLVGTYGGPYQTHVFAFLRDPLPRSHRLEQVR